MSVACAVFFFKQHMVAAKHGAGTHHVGVVAHRDLRHHLQGVPGGSVEVASGRLDNSRIDHHFCFLFEQFFKFTFGLPEILQV